MKYLAIITLLLTLSFSLPALACGDKNPDDPGTDRNPQGQTS